MDQSKPPAFPNNETPDTPAAPSTNLPPSPPPQTTPPSHPPTSFQTQTPGTPQAPSATEIVASPFPSTPSATPIYAAFGQRLVAAFLDGIIVGIISIVLGLILGVTRVAVLLYYAYMIYLTGSKGQTLGKMAFGIKVVKTDTDETPGYFSAFLREVVGKFLSSLVLLLGYLWMIWDSRKQTWHDKIAGTVVVKA